MFYPFKASAPSVTAALLACTGAASAGGFTLYLDQPTFLGALGGQVPTEQNFDGFASGTDMSGPNTFLPGVSASTNAERLEVFGGDTRLFALDRIADPTEYLFEFTGYFAVEFIVEAWDPESTSATVELTLLDGTNASFLLSQTGDEETDPVFFGIVSPQQITSITFIEGAETGARSEEVSFGLVGVAIPAPASATMLLFTGAALTARRRPSGARTPRVRA